MNEHEQFEYNNEEEAEMAQLHSLHINMNAVAEVQRKLATQRARPSLEFCEDCGEDIPKARQLAIPGVTLCVYCKEKSERQV
jgi:phage/conjugal plasmid C-4 type zinc finger TraR family protein